ncbi:nickel pincer cofactor biosynthesis protein LarC [Halorubrum laminariae]|uniref:Putative nickel insertion protein n=1 Tax=Halorubrum laminariae TaxID=1433523 RepID=A0ABD6C420_9EURY|nr:nickel pincer cofactor biosynthesis protein LarC [Halorubrum laminariae]
MRTLVFDGRTGAAGDMICAALIAAGADPAVLDPVPERLPVRYEVGKTTRNGIRATTVDVLLDGEGGDLDASNDDHKHDDHEHDGHDYDDHDHTHDHAEGAGVTRNYAEVVALVESMELPESVEAVALDAFELLGRAEASVHGTDLDETHFHEVGADDAIADVVGAALLLDDIDPDRVVTTPVATGDGEVTMAHGVYPLPAPATTEIATRADFAIRGGPVDTELDTELLTPTGAAILGAIAEGVDAVPDLDIDAAGYGAGDATFPEHPNVLRVLAGDGRGPAAEVERDRDAEGLVRDEIAVLETNLDDATPEVLGGLQETLSRVGARDVTVVPTTMKKSRPGHLVKVICRPNDAEAVAEALARETGTLGVRQSGASHRWIAERAFESAVISVDGTDHEVSVKVASTADGEVYDVSAEYDDAAAVAEKTGLPVREVLRRAETQVHAEVDG